VDPGVGNLDQKVIAAGGAGGLLSYRLRTMATADADLNRDAVRCSKSCAAFSNGAAQARALKIRTGPLLL